MSYLCVILTQPDISLKGVEITISNQNEKKRHKEILTVKLNVHIDQINEKYIQYYYL